MTRSTTYAAVGLGLAAALGVVGFAVAQSPAQTVQAAGPYTTVVPVAPGPGPATSSTAASRPPGPSPAGDRAASTATTAKARAGAPAAAGPISAPFPSSPIAGPASSVQAPPPVPSATPTTRPPAPPTTQAPTTTQAPPPPTTSTTAAPPAHRCTLTVNDQGHDTAVYSVASDLPGEQVQITFGNGTPEGTFTTDSSGSGSLTGNTQGDPPGTQATAQAMFYSAGAYAGTFCSATFTVR